MRADSHDGMNYNAEKLIRWLEARFQEQSNLGFSKGAIASELEWSTSKVRYVIDWCRNQMTSSRFLIHCFRQGGVSYYKKPTTEEAEAYEKARGLDIAVRSGHNLLGIRKRAAASGVTNETDKSAESYTEVLHWLREAGVQEAEDILEQALRELNGAH